MVFNNSLKNPLNKSLVVDIDSKEKKLIEYADLISPGILNENEVTSGLGFFSSTKAPKKKQQQQLKKQDDQLKKKRKRLENYFTTVDLDSWSERNFVLPNQKGENWHDDLHYIVLKQQEKSNLLHQLWLFLMLALFVVLLVSIAGIVYSNNNVIRNQDQSNSYEFVQKFIENFNHTEPKIEKPDIRNRYNLKQDHESNENWLKREYNYLNSILGARENEPLNLTKKEDESVNNSNIVDKSKRAAKIELIEDPSFRGLIEVGVSDLDRDLMMEESKKKESVVEKIQDNVEDTFEDIAKQSRKFFKKVKDMFEK